jgi:hypothetical protein
VGLQGLRLKRVLPLLLIVGCFAWSSSVGGLRFIPIYEALVVKAPKNSPPHIAFEEVLAKADENSEWLALDKKNRRSTWQCANPNSSLFEKNSSYRNGNTKKYRTRFGLFSSCEFF